jgi:DNA invertase Pin-like site-specific DNA recombinase
MGSSVFLAIYLRKSRDKTDIADPELLSKHRREMLRLAESRGDHIPPERIFEEVGSGERIRQRPVFRQVLEEIEQLPPRNTGRLYTPEVSRATRGNLTDQGRVEDALMRAQILHITRAGDYDLSRANDRFNWRIQASLASHELGLYKERVEAARLEMALEGKLLTGKPPLGWTWDKNKEQAVPNHLFPVVQAICRDAHSLSCYELAEKYNLPRMTILNLLRNPFIAGWPAKRFFPHNGERDWLSASHRVPPGQWIKSKKKADHLAACTLEEWEAIQRVLDQRRELREKRHSADGWCRDVLRFQGYEDRQPRLGSRSTTYQELIYELQIAPSRRLYVARDTVHAAAEAEVLDILRDAGALHDRLRRLHESPKPPASTAGLEWEIAALERRMGTLLDMQAEALETGDVEAVAEIRKKRADTKQKRDALLAQAKAAAPPIALTESATKRLLTRALLERVLVSCEPQPGRRAWRREVVQIRRVAWLL